MRVREYVARSFVIDQSVGQLRYCSRSSSAITECSAGLRAASQPEQIMKMRRDIGIEADDIVNAPYKHALPAHLNAKAKFSPDHRGGAQHARVLGSGPVVIDARHAKDRGGARLR